MADEGFKVAATRKQRNGAKRVAKQAAERAAYDSAPSQGRLDWFAEKDRVGKGGLNADYHALENTAKAHAQSGSLHSALDHLNGAIALRETAAENHGGADQGHQDRITMLRARRDSISRVLP